MCIRDRPDGRALVSTNFTDNLDYSSQPYEQLAAEYERLGMDGDANLVRYTMNKDREFASVFSLGFVKHWALWFFVGFGYRPWHAIVISVALIGAGHFVYRPRRMERVDAKSGANYFGEAPLGPFRALAFSCDVFIPLTNFYQASCWRPKKQAPFAVIYMYFQIIAGIFLTAVFAAAIGGILKSV